MTHSGAKYKMNTSLEQNITLTREEIKKYIPHRDPLLLIDQVHELVVGKKIIATKLLTADEPVFRGHFPEYSIYPGVYYVEAMAQCGALLSVYESNYKQSELGVLSSVDETRFRKAGYPGDTIRYEVSVQKARGPFVWFKGTAYIDNEIAVESVLSIAIGVIKGRK